MNTPQIQYSTKINSFAHDIKTCDAVKYQEICKGCDCYEKIPDDRPIKLYFDIDFYDADPRFTCDENLSEYLIEHGKKSVSQFCVEKFGIVPVFSVSKSDSASYNDWKTGKEKWKISSHLVVQNIIAMKSVQNELVKEINDISVC